jgi:hypothetical protein
MPMRHRLATKAGQAPGTGLLGAAFFELAWVEQKAGAWERASADANTLLLSRVR